MNTTESRLLHEDDLPNATPVITLELLSRSDRDHNASDRRENLNYTEGDTARPTLILDSSSGVHFLTEDQASSLFSPKLEPTHTDGEDTDDMALSPARSKQELLEYLIRSDGSVVCKLCGEILQSRTHWYRHKYKFHVAPAASPAPLYKCEQCSVFFKSRKGYIGHLASRHPEGEGSIGETSINMLDEPNIKQEPIDAELAIPRCELPNTNYTGAIVTATPNIVANTNCTVKLENKKVIRSTKGGSEGGSGDAGGVEWEKQRRREERLVADIIARVRRECEASGASGGARRGYSRRSALTNG